MSLKVLYDGQGKQGNLAPEIDIVAIHGLNPSGEANHGYSTWTKGDHIWLRDSLPESLPTCRTMLYIYDSRVLGRTKERFAHEASQLLEAISAERDECPRRPLFFIGHSLGGILIKQALVNGQANPKHQDILSATFALIFMGTPHQGPSDSSRILFGKTCAEIVRSVQGDASDDMMQAVEKNSIFSDTLKENWRHQQKNYQFISCHETIDPIVPYDSAILGLGGDQETILRRRTDHGDVCRFDLEDETDQEDFKTLLSNIKRLYKKATNAGEGSRGQDFRLGRGTYPAWAEAGR
jgi:hypothetical protein